MRYQKVLAENEVCSGTDELDDCCSRLNNLIWRQEMFCQTESHQMNERLIGRDTSSVYCTSSTEWPDEWLLEIEYSLFRIFHMITYIMFNWDQIKIYFGSIFQLGVLNVRTINAVPYSNRNLGKSDTICIYVCKLEKNNILFTHIIQFISSLKIYLQTL